MKYGAKLPSISVIVSSTVGLFEAEQENQEREWLRIQTEAQKQKAQLSEDEEEERRHEAASGPRARNPYKDQVSRRLLLAHKAKGHPHY